MLWLVAEKIFGNEKETNFSYLFNFFILNQKKKGLI